MLKNVLDGAISPHHCYMMAMHCFE